MNPFTAGARSETAPAPSGTFFARWGLEPREQEKIRRTVNNPAVNAVPPPRMNSRKLLVTLGVAASLAGVAAFAQENPPASSPAPAPAPEIAAPARARADRIVYSTQLPSVPQLMQMAQAQGTTVVNVEQTDTEVTVTYRLGNNSTRTVSYQLLPAQTTNATSAEPVTPAVQTPPPAPPPVQVVEVPAPETRVVYRYYDRYDPFYYDPFYWPRRAPISVNLGFGWDFGHRHYRHHHRHHRWRHW